MIIIRLICLAAYYGFARFLPASTSSRTKWARSIRRFICRPLFDACGDNVNVEKGAVFSTWGGNLYWKWQWLGGQLSGTRPFGDWR